MARVLIADALAEDAVQLLTAAGLDVTVATGRTEAQILSDIADYDAVVVRSATQVTPALIAAGARLRVIGRAGVGVDNIDVAAATARGVVVMNTPLGNVISAAEHTVALILALARHIPWAHADTRGGAWNRKAYTGVELENKVLGVIGLGKIGQHVVRVCRSLGMQILAYDPFINPERATAIGAELTTLDELLARGDFITLHVPGTPETHGLLDAAALAGMKPGARLINVARGGLVDETALAQALRDGRLAGAAVDVYSAEPVTAINPLLTAPHVILTPHLGASTREAQSKVAEAIARQLIAFFEEGVIQNAVNLSVTLPPEQAAYGQLASTLGALAVQLAGRSPVKRVCLHCYGRIAAEDTRALAVSALSGVLRETTTTSVNLVNAADVAERRGIELTEQRSRRSKGYVSRLTVELETRDGMRRVSGVCFDDATPRIVEIDGLAMEMKPAPHILIMRYGDRPGMVGKFGTVIGNARINIAHMDVGRLERGADAIVALTLDEPVPPAVLEQLRATIAPKELHIVSL